MQITVSNSCVKTTDYLVLIRGDGRQHFSSCSNITVRNYRGTYDYMTLFFFLSDTSTRSSGSNYYILLPLTGLEKSHFVIGGN